MNVSNWRRQSHKQLNDSLNCQHLFWASQVVRENQTVMKDIEYQGKHLRYCIINVEQFCNKAADWVQLKSITGKKNMSVSDFAGWVNNTLLPKAREIYPHLPNITNCTAVRWLNILGFHIMSSKYIGMYINGHERSDPVEYRKITIRRLEICHGSPPACVEEISECSFRPYCKDAILPIHD